MTHLLPDRRNARLPLRRCQIRSCAPSPPRDGPSLIGLVGRDRAFVAADQIVRHRALRRLRRHQVRAADPPRAPVHTERPLVAEGQASRRTLAGPMGLRAPGIAAAEPGRCSPPHRPSGVVSIRVPLFTRTPAASNGRPHRRTAPRPAPPPAGHCGTSTRCLVRRQRVRRRVAEAAERPPVQQRFVPSGTGALVPLREQEEPVCDIGGAAHQVFSVPGPSKTGPDARHRAGHFSHRRSKILRRPAAADLPNRLEDREPAARGQDQGPGGRLARPRPTRDTRAAMGPDRSGRRSAQAWRSAPLPAPRTRPRRPAATLPDMPFHQEVMGKVPADTGLFRSAAADVRRSALRQSLARHAHRPYSRITSASPPSARVAHSAT